MCVKTEKYDNGIVKLPKSSVLQFVIIACHFLGPWSNFFELDM